MEDKKYAKRTYPAKRLFRMITNGLAKTVPMSGYTRVKLYRLAGIDFEKGRSRCGKVRFDSIHPEDIHIGSGCEIVDGCVILSHFYDISEISSHSHLRGEVRIGRNVYMGSNCVITKPVVIGDGSVIGAGSIITKDIPPYEVWAGVPARFIKKRIPDE